MLTPAQINAETLDPITDEQIMNLTLLVRRYPVYINNLGLFPELQTKLIAEQTTPTVKTKGLKAVLTQLGVIPTFVVESQGSRDRPSHFATNDNWYDLALDVLDLFYEVPAGLTRQNYAVKSPISEEELFGINTRNNIFGVRKLF